jgi:hypothetical protein
MVTVTLYIQTVGDLESLLNRRRREGRPARLVLDVEGLAEADAKRWEARLSRYYFACGCESGSVALLIALAAYVIALALAPGGFGAANWRHVVAGVAVGFVAAGIGKVAGLIHARWRLRTTIRSLAGTLH